MNTICKTIVCVFFIAVFMQAKSAFAISVDLTPGVIGTAIDKQYDGVFEEILDNITTNNFETFTSGRVVDGSFVSERRSILEFNLASIGSIGNIASATLTMDSPSGSNALGVIDFYGFEGDGMLEMADATRTGNLVVSRTATDSHDVVVDVTSYIQGYLDSNIGWAGFLGVETVDGVNANFWSNYNDSYEQVCGPHSPPTCVDGEIIYISSQPTLSIVSAVPVPGAALLFSSGLFGLMAWSRSQRKRRSI